MSTQSNDSKQTSVESINECVDGIVEVYHHNFVSEIKNLSRQLNKYNYIGMDTEFPGSVYSLKYFTSEYYYKTIKVNVDSLKLIQVGITLSDSKGNKPEKVHTWQFNLKFDIKKDSYSNSSIELLKECGIDFNRIQKEGIPYQLFGEYLTTSGLFLNEDIVWVSFHGTYDFAYLLKSLTNSPLPNYEDEFIEQLSVYFPNIYDVKILAKTDEKFKGGLNKLGNYLNIKRKGKIHQAGSDSILTIDVFFKLIELKYIDDNSLYVLKNIIFGLGEGEDDIEMLSYTELGKCIEEVYTQPNSFSKSIVLKA